MTMLARLEDRAGAMSVYTKFATRLRKEFELEPSSETVKLVESIQRGAAV